MQRMLQILQKINRGKLLRNTLHEPHIQTRDWVAVTIGVFKYTPLHTRVGRKGRNDA